VRTSNTILIKFVKEDPSKELNASSMNTIKVLKKGISLLY
jgi:hypothetical protein